MKLKSWRPDGIRTSADLEALSLDVNDVASIAYPWRGLTKKTGGGLQLGTLVMICSGTGVGKTTLISQLALHLHKLGESCGMLCLEEHNNITLKRLLGIHSQTASDKFDANLVWMKSIKYLMKSLVTIYVFL